MIKVRGIKGRLIARLRQVGVWIAALFLATSSLVLSCGGNHEFEAGPMLQDVSTNSATVLWWNDQAETAVFSLREPDGQIRRISVQNHGSSFEAVIDSLQPSTEYEYWIESDPIESESPQVSWHFHTAPQSGSPLSFLVFGDSGSGNSSQYSLAEIMGNYPSEFILHTGDLVYDEGKLADYPRKFFLPYTDLLASMPFYPVLGNHDLRTDKGEPFLDSFSLPVNGPAGVRMERCFWFDYGDARLVGVDSNLDAQTLENVVAPWVRATLSSSPATWKFVFLHHPPWAGGPRPANEKIRDILVPAIEAGGADIVFCGHNHLYERTHPMLGGEVSPSDGVIYITSGAGGKSLYEERYADEPYLAAFNNTENSFTLVTVSGSSLVLSQIGVENVVLDRIVVQKNLDGIHVVENK